MTQPLAVLHGFARWCLTGLHKSEEASLHQAQHQAGLLPFSGSGSRSFYGCDGNLLNQYRRCARRQQRM